MCVISPVSKVVCSVVSFVCCVDCRMYCVECIEAGVEKSRVLSIIHDHNDAVGHCLRVNVIIVGLNSTRGKNCDVEFRHSIRKRLSFHINEYLYCIRFLFFYYICIIFFCLIKSFVESASRVAHTSQVCD